MKYQVSKAIISMKIIDKIFKLLFLIVISISFSQCASTMKLQKEAPTNFANVYTQNWVAGVKGGGAGVNIFIETINNDIALDSVFFRGKMAKLEVKPTNKNLFIGRFVSDANMDKTENLNKSKTESEVNLKTKDFPFKLKENECVISYQLDGKTNYYKLENIEERQPDELPMSTPPNKN